MKEKLQNKGPSAFVLIQNGSEKRLEIGEMFTLAPGHDHDYEPITVFSVTPAKNYLNLNLGFQVSSVLPQWGIVRTKFGTDEAEFDITLSNEALREASPDRVFIKGSSMHFDAQKTHLYGKDWTLEYRPL